MQNIRYQKSRDRYSQKGFQYKKKYIITWSTCYVSLPYYIQTHGKGLDYHQELIWRNSIAYLYKYTNILYSNVSKIIGTKNPSIDKFRVVSNTTETIVRIDPNAMSLCHTLYNHMEKGEIIIF